MVTPRNIRIDGRRTSIRLEPELWSALEHICEALGHSIDAACSAAARERADQQNITSAIRSYIVRNLFAVHGSASHGSPGWRNEDDAVRPRLAALVPP